MLCTEQSVPALGGRTQELLHIFGMIYVQTQGLQVYCTSVIDGLLSAKTAYCLELVKQCHCLVCRKLGLAASC